LIGTASSNKPEEGSTMIRGGVTGEFSSLPKRIFSRSIRMAENFQ
jgi:hypothetical protein